MSTLFPPSECERARAAISCRLDGELSELEDARLDVHLRDCAGCSAHALELHALIGRLRAAPLERPNISVFAPARHRPLVRLRAMTAAAAIVAVAAGSAFALGRAVGVHGGPTATRSTRAATADFLSLRADSNEQHILAMVPRLGGGTSLRSGRVIAV